ncbi:MAG: Asp-tRNA(Asn)/Glu-tRNA(Gln) amidotransferase subunit GatC [Chlamydiales bacterium]
MSDFCEESIKTLCALCRIEIAEEDFPALSKDLKRVLDYVELLNEVDVSHLSPYSHIEEQGTGSLREDEVGELLQREQFLNNAPDQVGGMIRVPPIIKQNP